MGIEEKDPVRGTVRDVGMKAYKKNEPGETAFPSGCGKDGVITTVVVPDGEPITGHFVDIEA